jgi:hypothetical protein
MSVTGSFCGFKMGGPALSGPPRFDGRINQVDGQSLRSFQSFFSLPALEIRSENEEFPADLDDPNPLFFNDSAEMPYGEPRHFCSIWNVQKRLPHHRSFGCLHGIPPFLVGELHGGCQRERDLLEVADRRLLQFKSEMQATCDLQPPIHSSDMKGYL